MEDVHKPTLGSEKHTIYALSLEFLSRTTLKLCEINIILLYWCTMLAMSPNQC